MSRAFKALELLSKTAYDVIISDMKMPGMNGEVFYNQVKRLRPESASRIIFMSGDIASIETRKFLRDTGNLYIQKPFTIQTLKETVSKLTG